MRPFPNLASLIYCLVIFSVLNGCMTVRHFRGSEKMIRTELYFGTAMEDGTVVSTKDWQRFLDNEITPRFSSGLSVIDVSGQWMMASGEVIREKSRAVLLIHTNSAENEQAISEIIQAYTERFSQEAVMRVSSVAKVKF